MALCQWMVNSICDSQLEKYGNSASCTRFADQEDSSYADWDSPQIACIINCSLHWWIEYTAV